MNVADEWILTSGKVSSWGILPMWIIKSREDRGRKGNALHRAEIHLQLGRSLTNGTTPSNNSWVFPSANREPFMSNLTVNRTAVCARQEVA